MFPIKYLFYFILLHLIIGHPQINLHHTGWVRENENNDVLQHDCLRLDILNKEENASREIISYCMSELPSKFQVEENDLFPKFTFSELSYQNITSQQLYLWSASIDTIEDYQSYLNELSIFNKSALSKEVFYNCTLPRFGSMCQYEIDYKHSEHSSLNDIITDFYRTHEYKPINYTCYTHLQCNRGHSPTCLDWTEICNGEIDCLDGGIDEEYCWQLEINECNDNEYRCTNGQCVPKAFFQDDKYFPDCLDGSDESYRQSNEVNGCSKNKPSFKCEDVTCEDPRCGSKKCMGSCWYYRQEIIFKSMFSVKDNSTSDQCWSAFVCSGINLQQSSLSNCVTSCANNDCYKVIENECPDKFYMPTIPVLFGDIYFAYEKCKPCTNFNKAFKYPYICYNNSRYDSYFNETSKMENKYTTFSFNNRMCHRRLPVLDLPTIGGRPDMITELSLLHELHPELWQYQEIYNYNLTICNRSNMYQCSNSFKCISIYRLMNGINDCPNGDDENITSVNYTIPTEESIDTGIVGIPEDKRKLLYARKHISFQTICDGFTELAPITIDGQDETDETECEHWSCNNVYTHCNGLWNCLNGEDEIDCGLSSSLNCSSDEHQCVSLNTSQFMCLPITKANDGRVDCIGATDEPKLCRKEYQIMNMDNFHCIHQKPKRCIDNLGLCNGIYDCDHGDDEQFCTTDKSPVHSICLESERPNASNVEGYLCDQVRLYQKERIVSFTLNRMKKSLKDQTKQHIKHEVRLNPPITVTSIQQQLHCHRGIDVRMWLNDKTNRTRKICFCPPSYYGDQCQYQNQRVSLSIKLITSYNSWKMLFAIVILLIDDDNNKQIIHSSEQFTYLSIRDCHIKKRHINLIYSNQPKDQTKNYGIQIHIYEKKLLNYRGSFYFPIKFSFLPVHRLSLIVGIPDDNINFESCSDYPCINGKCIKYRNNEQKIFCQCNKGWSGRYCTIEHSSLCSSRSVYIGVSPSNQSICICPMNTFGYRCLLNNMICQNNENLTCQNGGECIPTDEYMISKEQFTCICRKGYFGERCELNDNKIILSFEKSINVSQSIFIHFIEVMNNDKPLRLTTSQTIPIKQKFVTILWSKPFHIVFVELLEKKYYLILVQNIYIRSKTINQLIKPSDRCKHINEIFNDSIAKSNIIRRIKYYHLPCQMSSLNLSCFYDDIHLCLCYNHYKQRLANCFEFDHNMTFNCFGRSLCQNGGDCFQDALDCPTRSICVCPSCYFGTQCQFSTSGFGLSLDAILGYHIVPNANIKYQPVIVILSLILSILFIIAGFINGILAMITFKNKVVHDVGCGLYLLGSSITTLLIMILFGLKCWILIFSQMGRISNRTFLRIQCITLDFLLQSCLNMDQWLNACVAGERAYTIIKGTRFQKKKSKTAAKIIILILIIVIISTSIYDPFYRRLIDEENDDEIRIWCIITYSSSLKTFQSAIHGFHFIAPFVINLVSSIVLITRKSRQQSNLRTDRTYYQLLRQQLREHKNLLIAPVILVILALPRLIISYVSNCMKSASNPWIYLILYFISFIPPMLTFIIYVLPSKFYKQEFNKTIERYRINIRRRLQVV
ncbi:unnamed protein product [Adineta steineri]|uniref:Uncharacterized protein n=1 Tax=Adineta steineri TaxID=433720 RepID=A0A815LQQ6_9BILA|nr:unnamed protein product [Adineta steineri]CAF1617213.1 unnamed protein product [Adineta steineri]